MGDIVLDNGVKKETAKGLTEEELTGALVRVEKNGAKTICASSTATGEAHFLDDTGRDGYSTLKDALGKNNYKSDTISLIEKPDIPKTCSVVVVGGPKHDYLQPAIDALKNFVTGGGRVIVNFDPVLNLPQQKMGETPTLAALVEQWGITPNGGRHPRL